MQIHELNTKALTDPAWVPFDDGSDTYKADFNQIIDDAVAAAFTSADVSGGVVEYESEDAEPLSGATWSPFDLLEGGENLETLFTLVSAMAYNLRFLWSVLGNDALKVVPYSKSYSLAASSGIVLTANDFGATTPTGYTPIGCAQFSSGETRAYVRGMNVTATGTTGMLYMQNTSASAINATAYIQILYAKTILL